MTSAPASARPWITPALLSRLRAAVMPRAALLWMYLWAKADRETGETWPTTREIAAELSSRSDHVCQDILRLESYGWLKVNREPGGRSRYRILSPSEVSAESGALGPNGVGGNGCGVSAESGAQRVLFQVHRQLITTKDSTKDSTKGEAAAPPSPTKADGRRRFVPPTLEEIRAYFAQKRFTSDPDALYAHYTANGWVQNRGKPIKDWHSAADAWEIREKKWSKERTDGRNDRTHLGPGNLHTPGAEQADPTVGKW